MQTCCPNDSANVPPEHASHSEAPTLELLVPGRHWLHVEMSIAPVRLLNVPAGHKEHTADEVAASDELYVPGGQSTHCEEPGTSPNEPLGQAVQLTELPDTACRYPSAQRIGGKTTSLCTPWPAAFSS